MPCELLSAIAGSQRCTNLHLLTQLISYSKNWLESAAFYFFSIPVFHQPYKQGVSKLQKHTLLQRAKIMLHDQVICTVTHVLAPRQTQ